MKEALRRHAAVLLLAGTGLLLHLAGIGHPRVVVWDECFFARFAQAYHDRAYFFDIHPPLGKLILAAGLGAAGGSTAEGFTFAGGSAWPAGFPYVAVRLLPALAGGLLPLLIFAVGRALGFSRRGALLAGALVLFENAILCESRLALIDVFLHVFTYAAFLAFLLHRKTGRRPLLAVAGLLAGAALSVKWTGIGALGVMAAVSVAEALGRRTWRILPERAALLGLPAVAVYLAGFLVHLAILSKPGEGLAFMSPEFRAAFPGTEDSRRPELPPLGAFGRFLEVNSRMYNINVDHTWTHDDSSRWYQWPLGRKAVCFWSDPADKGRRVFLAVNPVVWIFGTASLAGGLWFLLVRRSRLRELMAADPAWRERVAALEFLLMAYLVHLLPYASISRPMFLYHYFTAQLSTILLGALVVVEIIPAAGWRGAPAAREASPGLTTGLVVAAAAAFVIVSPVTYGYRPFLALQSSLLPMLP